MKKNPEPTAPLVVPDEEDVSGRSEFSPKKNDKNKAFSFQ
jgi:hypothetical protein